jgi:apoptosis-inducing factor 3
MPSDHIVAKTTDLQDGEMKEVEIGEKFILLTRVEGKFHAVGGKCTHYDGPLAKGVLCGHRVVCPWHSAVFDVITGNVLEPPAVDALPHYDLRVEGDNVIVTLPDEVKSRRVMPMATYDLTADGRTFAIIGAGAAGHAAAEALRQGGFKGRIVMITREKHLPYDRPDLSKGYLATAEHEFSPRLRSEKFYAKWDIEVMTNSDVASLDVPKKTIEFGAGWRLKYEKALLATGSTPRRLDVPGETLENVFTLRSLDDADRISAAVAGAKNAVVVGASFIGTETAACLTKRGLTVTLVAPDAVPFERTLGKQVGQMFLDLHQANGVRLAMNARITAFEGNGRVRQAVLDDGRRLDADLVIVGIGVTPATGFVKGLKPNADGGILVDRYFHAAEDLYVAGDVAQFPDWRTNEPIRVEHWRVAQQQGRCAAFNMLGQETPFHGVPFFWTNQFKLGLRYLGYARTWDEILFDGDPATRKFVAYYVKGNHVLAAAGVDESLKMGAIHELMRVNRMPTPDELRGKKVDLIHRLTA